MSSEWEERQREWQLKEQEFARNAVLKRRIVSRAQQLAGSDDFKAAGAEMKRLGAEFKAAGFAGKGANDALWNAFSAARTAFYERRDVYYQQKDAEAAENARRKRHIVGELQGIVNSSDIVQAGGRVKELHAQWATIGYASFEENKQLNDAYYQLRSNYYARTNEYWDDVNAQRERNRQYREQLISQALFMADAPNPGSYSRDFQQLIQKWSDAGPVSKEHWEDLNRRFWSAKERFYLRRSSEVADPQGLKQGTSERSSVTGDPAWRPKNYTENLRYLEQAIRDQEQVAQRATDHYNQVRAKGTGWGLVPSKQAVNLEKARTHERIEYEKLDKLKARYEALYNRGR